MADSDTAMVDCPPDRPETQAIASKVHQFSRRRRARAHLLACCVLIWGPLQVPLSGGQGEVRLPPARTVSGYVALLLINETPVPGERGWQSEEDTEAAMLSILWVLNSRLKHIPSGYRQEQVAAQRCADIIDVITAGGEKGQCDGFYRDEANEFVAVPRVHERIAYLVSCANQGQPGRIARLLNFASGLADKYVNSGIQEADRFAGLKHVGKVMVTGRAYSWMTDRDYYSPGGNFVKIPDKEQGELGGNRFFTLRKLR